MVRKLSLGGGGAACSFHLGVMTRFRKDYPNFKFDTIVTNSGGGLALICAYAYDFATWCDLVSNMTATSIGIFYNLKFVDELVTPEVLNSVPTNKWFVNVCDTKSGLKRHLVDLSNVRQARLLIKASAAIPLLTRRVKVLDEDTYYYDGGVPGAENLPLLIGNDVVCVHTNDSYQKTLRDLGNQAIFPSGDFPTYLDLTTMTQKNYKLYEDGLKRHISVY